MNTIETDLLRIKYLVFSSHKTATQTVSLTLNKNGLKSRHCHILDNIGMKTSDFIPYLEKYYSTNGRKLNIITAFREPIERHISSFFQWYGAGVIRSKLVSNTEDTIIHNFPIPELQRMLTREIDDRTIAGIEESLDQICTALALDIGQLRYDTGKNFGSYDGETFKLYIFRFDILVKNLEHLLSTVSGRNVVQHKANLSEHKWYKHIYSEFKGSLKLPASTIVKTYESRRHIIELLYPGCYNELLGNALRNYR